MDWANGCMEGNLLYILSFTFVNKTPGTIDGLSNPGQLVASNLINPKCTSTEFQRPLMHIITETSCYYFGTVILLSITVQDSHTAISNMVALYVGYTAMSS